MKPAGGASAAQLAKALQGFARAPGNYLVRRGEPPELHAQLGTLAAWAIGRVPATHQERARELREAAVLFIQRACFAPDNTHYQVLGLAAESLTPAALRTRYRALIRLTHPDMGVQGLPSDAAGIVNRAHEVLRDPDLRQKYDDQLAQRATQHTVVVTAERGATVVDLRRIDLRPGWSDRWQLMSARHPMLVRFGVAAGAFGLLGLGILLWATSETSESRLLIVAAANGPTQRDKPEAALVASTVTVNSSSGFSVQHPSSDASRLPSSAPLPVETKPAKPDVEPVSMLTSARPGTTTSPSTAYSPTGAERNEPVVEPLQPRLPTSPEWIQSADLRANRPATAQFQTTVTLPVPVAATPASQVIPSGATSDSPPELAVARSPVVPPVPPTSGPTWSIDTLGAKHYLTNVISALERPGNAQRTNTYLADMKVQGSLLRPALMLMRQYQGANIEQMTWTDSQRPGMMKVQGLVVLVLRAADPDDNRKVNFQLSAEFSGTRNGTVLSSLNLKEGD